MNKVQLLECGLIRKGIAVTAAMFLAMASRAVAQQAIPSPPPEAPPGPTAVNAQGTLAPRTTAAATAERVIVSGSNSPTAAEGGAGPVGSSNRATMSKSGER